MVQIAMNEISDRDLLTLILAADDEALAEGDEPKQRTLSVLPKVMQKLGYTSFIMAGAAALPIVKRIVDLHGKLYRSVDVGVGGVHGGVFMFRDIFVRVSIPIIYGSVSIDPIALGEFSPNQVRWLHSRPKEFHAYLDQFTDIMDFAGAIAPFAGYASLSKAPLEVLWLSAFQLQAAAAALTAAFDFRGAVQSALIGAELALKSGLTFVGANDKQKRDHGHNLGSAAKTFSRTQTGFDLDRVLSAITKLPAYVANRYSPAQPSRIETGHIVMGAQYIAAEVVRQMTGYSFRSAMIGAPQRSYPSL